MHFEGLKKNKTSNMFPRSPKTIKIIGVHITTIDYLRVLIIEIGSTIILMVVEAQGVVSLKFDPPKKIAFRFNDTSSSCVFFLSALALALFFSSSMINLTIAKKSPETWAYDGAVFTSLINPDMSG